MDELPGDSARRCQCTRGVILVTPCPAMAVDRCFRCGMWLCLEHAMPVQGGILCPTCAATDDPEADEPLAPMANAGPLHDDDLFSDADYEAFEGAGDADMNAGVSDGFDS